MRCARITGRRRPSIWITIDGTGSKAVASLVHCMCCGGVKGSSGVCSTPCVNGAKSPNKSVAMPWIAGTTFPKRPLTLCCKRSARLCADCKQRRIQPPVPSSDAALADGAFVGAGFLAEVWDFCWATSSKKACINLHP
uniref:Uncharacterized protein n=1 Tax=mine drainage metagenome TaxID=410659 RepID=E6PQJ6_9ZZZZ